MTISLIVALSENDVIGRDGDMPWRLSSDLKRFKRLTMGHHIIMGRKTYESIGRPLPGRTSVVVSRTAHYDDPAILVARGLEEAFSLVEEDAAPMIIGGAEIYRQSLSWASKMYVTRVHACFDGDTFFPKVNWQKWELTESQRHDADEKNQYDYSFQTYQRER